MKLEQQVTSLELSKQLKKLGFEQDSLFYWNKIKEVIRIETFMAYEMNGNTSCSAFTSSELGEMLPEGYFTYAIQKIPKTWQVGDYRYENHKPVDNIYKELNIWTFGSNTEANARAKMLIYLKENELLKEWK